MKPSIFGCGPPQALAVAGLSVLGRDRFGVFPLRGKLRNARRPRQLPEGLKKAEAVNQAFLWI